MFAELCERAMDASFEHEFDLAGRFVPVEVKGRRYWYFDRTEDGGSKRRYVGPVADQEITRRVESFKVLKNDHKSRRRLVTSLVRDAGFAQPVATSFADPATPGLLSVETIDKDHGRIETRTTTVSHDVACTMSPG